MKEQGSNIPYKRIMLLGILSLLSGIIGLFFGVSGTMQFNFDYIFIGIIASFCALTALKFYWKQINQPLKQKTPSTPVQPTVSASSPVDFSFTTLGAINSKGFSITTVYNRSIGKPVYYHWKNAQTVVLMNNYTQLKIIFNDQSELMLDDSYSSWHALLKSIPKGFENFPYNIVQKLSPKYSNCTICGAIAVFYKTQRCKCCNNKLHPEASENDIKERQLEWFAFLQTKTPEQKKGFPIYPDWIPLVSAQEILDYQKSKSSSPSTPIKKTPLEQDQSSEEDDYLLED